MHSVSAVSLSLSSASFSQTLDSKEESRKEELYGKIPRRTSVDRPPFWITEKHSKKNFIGSTWRQVEGGVDDVTFSRQ